MTTSTPATPAVVPFDPSVLAEVIIDAAKSRGKIAREFRSLAESAYGDKDKQNELSVMLGQIRHVVATRSEAVAKRLGADNRDAFKKAVINQLAYASKVAGDTAGCLFKWNQKAKTYAVKDLPAANEPSPATAKGKDENSAEQSAAIVSAAEAAPELTKAQRLAKLDGVLVGLLNDGFTMAEIEAAFHGMAAHLAAGEAERSAQDKAVEPRAPGILQDKLTAELAAKGQAKPAQRKRAAKAAA